MDNVTSGSIMVDFDHVLLFLSFAYVLKMFFPYGLTWFCLKSCLHQENNKQKEPSWSAILIDIVE